MNKKTVSVYHCPHCKSSLKLKILKKRDTEILDGVLSDKNKHKYFIKNGIPHLLNENFLDEIDSETREDYDNNAKTYDLHMEFCYKNFFEDEKKIRKLFVDMLEIKPSSKVLEVGCGTGKDSEFIAQKLNHTGRLFLQDISEHMIQICKKKFYNCKVPIEFAVTNGLYLPFPDGFFDSVFHFGGINRFSDIGKTLKEFARVTRVGGKVVVGDESVPPWLRETMYGKILMNSNPLYQNKVPLEQIPENARNVKVSWIVGNAFYVIEFIVGKGLPQLDMDAEFPGKRGGTHRTRYFGKIEGITIDVKNAALRASEKSGKSFHKWLDEVIAKAAEKQLGEKITKSNR